MNNIKKLKQIGTGRYGQIYLGDRNGQSVVIKTVDLISIPKADKLLLQKEVELHKLFSSEYIVKFYESYEQNALQSIVLEYCNAGDLRKQLNLRKLQSTYFSYNQIFEWTYQILKALENIHGHNIIHRDLKPENILLHEINDNKLICRVADFGLSIQLQKDCDLPTSFTGTPLYMAPELVIGYHYSYMVDIWSLGCIIYELITFDSPFDAEELHSVLKNIVYEKYKPLPINCDPRLCKLVEIFLNKSSRPSVFEILKYDMFKIFDDNKNNNNNNVNIVNSNNNNNNNSSTSQNGNKYIEQNLHHSSNKKNVKNVSSNMLKKSNNKNRSNNSNIYIKNKTNENDKNNVSHENNFDDNDRNNMKKSNNNINNSPILMNHSNSDLQSTLNQNQNNNNNPTNNNNNNNKQPFIYLNSKNIINYKKNTDLLKNINNSNKSSLIANKQNTKYTPNQFSTKDQIKLNTSRNNYTHRKSKIYNNSDNISNKFVNNNTLVSHINNNNNDKDQVNYYNSNHSDLNTNTDNNKVVITNNNNTIINLNNIKSNNDESATNVIHLPESDGTIDILNTNNNININNIIDNDLKASELSFDNKILFNNNNNYKINKTNQLTNSELMHKTRSGSMLTHKQTNKTKSNYFDNVNNMYKINKTSRIIKSPHNNLKQKSTFPEISSMKISKILLRNKSDVNSNQTNKNHFSAAFLNKINNKSINSTSTPQNSQSNKSFNNKITLNNNTNNRYYDSHNLLINEKRNNQKSTKNSGNVNSITDLSRSNSSYKKNHGKQTKSLTVKPKKISKTSPNYKRNFVIFSARGKKPTFDEISTTNSGIFSNPKTKLKPISKYLYPSLSYNNTNEKYSKLKQDFVSNESHNNTNNSNINNNNNYILNNNNNNYILNNNINKKKKSFI